VAREFNNVKHNFQNKKKAKNINFQKGKQKRRRRKLSNVEYYLESS